MMMLNIQMNNLLNNDEAENGINPNSEDLDAEEDDGALTSTTRLTNLLFLEI